MTPPFLIDDAPPPETGDLAMALDRLESAVSIASRQPDETSKECLVWNDDNLRIHHASYRDALLIGTDSVARRMLRDRSPRSKRPADVDLSSGWTLIDTARLAKRGEFSRQGTLHTTRAWLLRTLKALRCATTSGTAMSDHPLTALCDELAPFAAGTLPDPGHAVGVSWNILFTPHESGLQIAAVTTGRTAVPKGRGFGTIPRALLPDPAMVDDLPARLQVDGAKREVRIRPWQRQVRSDGIASDPVTLARRLRDPDTSPLAAMLFERRFR